MSSILYRIFTNFYILKVMMTMLEMTTPFYITFITFYIYLASSQADNIIKYNIIKYNIIKCNIIKYNIIKYNRIHKNQSRHAMAWFDGMCLRGCLGLLGCDERGEPGQFSMEESRFPIEES